MSDTASAPPALAARAGWRTSVMLGVSLHDHRQLAVVFAPGRDHLDVFRHLAHSRAHATLAHAVRAAEVEFNAVGARVFHQRQDVLPALFHTRHHQRDDHGAVGPVAFNALDLFEVGLQRPVGDQLDVVQADHAAVLRHERGIARAVDVDHCRVFAQRLPHHAAPARLKGTGDVDLFVGGWCGGQPEGVRALDAQEIAANVCHGCSRENWGGRVQATSGHIKPSVRRGWRQRPPCHAQPLPP